MNPTWISCGVKSFREERSERFFLPVLETHFFYLTHESLSTIADCDAYLFTSRYAVDSMARTFQGFESIFFRERESMPILAAVGPRTALDIRSAFKKLDSRQIKVLESEAPGLQPLFQKLESVQELSSQSRIAILTSKGGRTRTTVSEYISGEHLFENLLILETYETRPCPQLTLEALRVLTVSVPGRIIFECRSGQVLSQLAACLVEFYAAQSVNDIPERFAFSLWGQSTLTCASKLKLSKEKIFERQD